MPVMTPSFTIGIEEEYMLVDPSSGEVAVDPPPDLPERCAKRCDGMVSHEFLRSQIEIGTPVAKNIKEAARKLSELRQVVIEESAKEGLAPIAASTHPFASWFSQKHTEKARYDALNENLQTAARRLLTCGMHVHVGIEDDELRVDLMRQFAYTLPHLLALSCSSPFWVGENTGLKCYRLTVFGAMPRTGLPEYFASWPEYQRHINVMVDTNIIEDATHIWWDMRPSARYPTLEMRITDVCPLIEDAISLAALTVCTLRMLTRIRYTNMRWRIYLRFLIEQNRWRAMRYSFDHGMVDFARGEVVAFKDILDELLELTAPDAEALDCVEEIQNLRKILERGTSAHRQIRCYEDAVSKGATKDEALRSIVKQLVDETARLP
ncbi:MAG: carboxylate-amine ligase [Gammaproteobacteria bacterium]|nr:carboxylate-amine ligase [Gammaproteobacteria bacterium]